MEEVSLKALLEAGCHFGHKSDRWHPKAAKFIFQERDGIHVIDLAKTKAGLEKAAEYVKSMAAEGKKVMFVGTKRQAAAIVKVKAAEAGAPFIAQRWIGGFLTNWSEVHKNLQKIRRLTEEQADNAWKKYPKHERVKLGRYLTKLNFLYGGVVQLTQVPDVLFVVDIKKEKVAVFEAKRMGIPVIGMVDTNSDPDWADYVIPSNDDAVGAIEFIVSHIAQAYTEGVEAYGKHQAEEQKKAEKAAKDAAEAAAKLKNPTDEVKRISQELQKAPVRAVEKPAQTAKPAAPVKPAAVKPAAKATEEKPSSVKTAEGKPKEKAVAKKKSE